MPHRPQRTKYVREVGCSGRSSPSGFDAVLLDLAIQALAIDPEQACCLILVALRPFEGDADHLALDVLEPRDLLVAVRNRRLPAHGRRQVVEIDLAVPREREGALDGVAELADVSRPEVRGEGVERPGRHPLRLDPVRAAIGAGEMIDEG